MLGLMALAPKNTLVVDPALPEWLPEVTARHIQVGTKRAALRFSRLPSGRTEVEVLDAGGLVIVRPDLAGLTRGQDRAAAAFRAALRPEPATLLGHP